MSETDFFICLDGGGSKTAGRLVTQGGAVLASATAGPCNPFTDPETAVSSVTAVVDAVLWDAGLRSGDRSRSCLAIGTAGAVSVAVKDVLRSRLTGFAEVVITTDSYAALIGATGGAPGAIVIVGTGAVGQRLNDDGTSQLFDGWGFQGGDRGSGAWIGREAVLGYLSGLDFGSGQGSVLVQGIVDQLGTTRADCLNWLHGAPPAKFASLVPEVLRATEVGDPMAITIIDRAVEHICGLAEGCVSGTNFPLYAAGGLAPALTPMLEDRLGRRVLTPAATALDGIERVARGQAPFERWKDP